MEILRPGTLVEIWPLASDSAETVGFHKISPPGNWVKITVFYAVFCLVSIFLCMDLTSMG